MAALGGPMDRLMLLPQVHCWFHDQVMTMPNQTALMMVR